ncbi:hypothetical protein Leryth_017091 [Lithospermum erythrorhizon]|nr:hypothetical protein Leryth_017091 [Lithospermum erythrorhizon]
MENIIGFSSSFVPSFVNNVEGSPSSLPQKYVIEPYDNRHWLVPHLSQNLEAPIWRYHNDMHEGHDEFQINIYIKAIILLKLINFFCSMLLHNISALTGMCIYYHFEPAGGEHF